jgi:sulfate transport system ATP-binding protein
MSIEITNISKKFGEFTALDSVSLSIPSGEITALLGPSGSGKTTLLRIIAGLEVPDTGTIGLFGEDATNKRTKDRRVGFVFQHYALFKHMSVFENIAFGLRVKPRALRPGKQEIRDRVFRLLSLVQLESLANRLPSELSGGQKQRVALARALAVEPQVLLLDEPFGALDAKVRKELRRWLRQLHDELHITSIFVTHDQEEALEVADRVVLMNRGRVEQTGAPEEVYRQPATPFVYGFLGAVNLFHGRVDGEGVRVGDDLLPHPAQEGGLSEGAQVMAFARPYELDIVPGDGPGGGITAKVSRMLSFGVTARIELDGDDGQHFEVELTRERVAALGLAVGQAVRLAPSNLRVFEYEKGAGI